MSWAPGVAQAEIGNFDESRPQWHDRNRMQDPRTRLMGELLQGTDGVAIELAENLNTLRSVKSQVDQGPPEDRARRGEGSPA